MDAMDFLTKPGVKDVVNIIFENLDDQSLANCRLVSTSWKEFVSGLKYYDIRVLSRKTGLEFKSSLSRDVLNQLKEEFSNWNSANLEYYTFEHRYHGADKKSDWYQPRMSEFAFSALTLFGPKDIPLETPFHLAACRGHLEICQLIIENVKDKNPKDNYGCTPLHLAAWTGRLEIVELICRNVEEKWYRCDLAAFKKGRIHKRPHIKGRRSKRPHAKKAAVLKRPQLEK